MLRTFCFTAVFLIVAVLAYRAASAEPGSAFGIEKRIPWNDSHVVGFPGTPPPYRAVNAFPKLKIVCPIAVAHQPGSDRLILIQQMFAWGGHGKVLRIKDDPSVETTEELLDLDGIAYGLAFHPDFEKNGFLYIGDNGPMSGKKKTRVTRYTMETKPPYKLDPKSAKIVIEWDSDGHNGGDVTFGKDGMLYVTSGDGTSDSDTNLAGQNLTHLLAKVLRLDVDHPEPGKMYSVPKDNPFVGKDGIRPETWAYGFRNPWRIHADRQTGDLWVGQNGQDLWEPVYLVQKGANYGWSAYEGSHPFYPERLGGPSPLSKPLVEHHHSEARSLTGGVVYRGDKLPELRGAYLYGDWSTGKIWGVKQEAGKVAWHKELTTSVMQITGFGLDSHGELLIADHGGNGLFRLERAPKEEKPAKFPTKLSETGLFESVKGHRPHAALVPYSVNAPLWSDGADKERFLAIPGDGQIEFGTGRGWNVPEGTVLVKTFSYEMPSGSKRRFETRLTTKTLGQWYGYSYRWNDEQTEAELVPVEGADTVIEVRDPAAPGGVRKQAWHYPSRAECMVCHSRAANFVLGLTSWQMNKIHDYGTVKADQLKTLGHLKLFSGDAFEKWDKDKAAREKRLVDPSDKSASLEARAKSYLQANCAICHVDAGGGNAQIDLEFTTPLKKMRLLDVKPLHDSFGIKDAKLIVPGDPERSVLFQRIARRGPGQMPPLASTVVDREAVELFRAWIKEMK